MATKKKTPTKAKKPFKNARKTRMERGHATTADRWVEPGAVGAPARAIAAPEARTIPCKKCKLRIEFTTGLDEMAKHWEEEHPDALANLRRKIDDRSRFPRE